MTDMQLTQIEETMAHQEKQINDLSEMVIAQGTEIERLRRHIQKLEGKMEELEEDINSSEKGEPLSSIEKARAEKPPHY